MFKLLYLGPHLFVGIGGFLAGFYTREDFTRLGYIFKLLQVFFDQPLRQCFHTLPAFCREALRLLV